MTETPVPMPCGCPYPKIGDHRPCPHGDADIDCPSCGYGYFDLIPRSLDPIHLRCCRCGTETTIPFRCAGASP